MRSQSSGRKADSEAPRTYGWGQESLPPWDTLFAYDRWANERWIAFTQKHQWKAANDVLEHIVRASEIWLSRIHQEEPPGPSASSLKVRLAACHSRWLQTLLELIPEKVIRYTNMADDPFESYMGDIAAHVVNHGTYHRGQLRERAEANGFSDFPETDLILFFRETAPRGSL
ncbi:MAG: hypothetical protein C4341_05335 [Armatimonadota bacterium]